METPIREKEIEKMRFKFSEVEITFIFESWLKKIQELINIIEYRGPFNQEKIFDFFRSFMASLEGDDSYKYYQMLDNALPFLRKQQVSEQDILLILSDLREIILQTLIPRLSESAESHRLLSAVLKKFDDLSAFIQRNALLQLQINGEDSPLQAVTAVNQLPAGVFHIQGPRLSGKVYINPYLANLLGVNEKDSLDSSFWKKQLTESDYRRLGKYFEELYRNRKKFYQVHYSLQLKNSRIPVTEEGSIEYNQENQPLEIYGLIQKGSMVQRLKERLSLEQKKYQLLRSLSAHLVVMCDNSGSIINFNPSLPRLLKIPSEKLMNSQLTDWVSIKNNQGPIAFGDLLRKFGENEKVTLLLKTGDQRVISFNTRLGILTTPDKFHQYLFVGWQAGLLDDEFKRRLELLIEIQKELSFKVPRQNIYDKILEDAIILLPVADGGSILKIEEDGLHFVATHQYDAEQLKKIVLFKGNPERYLKHSTQVKMIHDKIAVKEIANIGREAAKVFSKKDLEIMRQHGKLDEIKSTLTGIISLDTRPSLMINLDILKEGKNFSENDIYLFNIYLQQVYVLLGRIRLLDKIQESEINYRTLFENSPLPTYIHQDDRFVLVNPKFYELSGYSPAEINNLNIWELVHPDDRAKLMERAASRLQGKFFLNEYEFRAVRKDGEIIPCIGYFSRVTFNGRPAILGEISDISKIKSLEQQLLQAQKLETIGTLTAGIAHDFNNIIGTIAPSAQLIMMDPENPSTRQRAEIIYKMADRAGKLTRQLLAFSRNEKTRVTPFNLNELILSSRSLIEKTIHVKTRLRLDLEDGLKTIEGDPNQFIQILLNLVVNANDALPNGGEITIRTRNIEVDESYRQWDAAFKPGPYVHLTVQDNGPGISPEIRDKIFDPFFTTKERSKGTGLGLSMVYGITKSHHGIIRLKSDTGQGTTFELFFPASQKEAVTDTIKTAVKVPPGKRTILAVDDEDELRVILAAILKHLGYQAILAKNGKEAVEIYRKNKDKIDLVLLDYIMPEMDGRETFRKLKKLNKKVKVIVSTGYSEKEGIQELIREGLHGVLAKPFTIESISQKLEEVFASGSKN